MSSSVPEGAKIRSMRQFTPQAEMEMVSFLQPWFLQKKGGGPGTAIERDLLIIFDGIGAVIAVNAQGDVRLDMDFLILGWTLLADQTGSIDVDIWKAPYSSYPPNVGNTITASAPPTITSGVKNTSTALTGWDTVISAGDCLRFNIDSISAIERITLALHLQG